MGKLRVISSGIYFIKSYVCYILELSNRELDRIAVESGEVLVLSHFILELAIA